MEHMNFFPAPVERLIEQFEKLPSVGKKSAQRLAFHVLNMNPVQAKEFAEAILQAKDKICLCKTCFNLTDREECSVCTSETRDKSVICVVSDPKDVLSIERAREYKGVYHVLHGCISPLNGTGPNDIKLKELVIRVSSEQVKEVIMATNSDTEGDTTAIYAARLLKPFGVLVTRLAYGIPVGGHLEYADDVTLMRALDGRTAID